MAGMEECQCFVLIFNFYYQWNENGCRPWRLVNGIYVIQTYRREKKIKKIKTLSKITIK